MVTATQTLQPSQAETAGKGGRSRARKLLGGLFLAVLVYCAGSVPSPYDSETLYVTSASTVPIGYFFLYFTLPLAAALTLQHFFGVRRALRHAWLPAMLVAWSLATSLWSIDQRTTLFSAVCLAACLVIVADAGRYIDERTATKLIAFLALGLCGASLVLGIAVPQYGLMNVDKFAGQLRGIYSHKNILGGTASLMFLWVVCAYAAGRFERRTTFAVVLVVGATILWAWSVTPIVMLIACSGILMFLRSASALRMNTWMLAGVIAATAVLVIVVLTSVNTEAIFGLFNKDATLTGRDLVWDAYLSFAAERPMLGHGFNALNGAKDFGVDIVWSGGGTPSAHNSFLQMYATIGGPATILFVFLNFKLVIAGIRMVGVGDRRGYLYVIFPIGSSINSFLESTGGVGFNLSFMLLTYLAVRSPVKPAAQL